MISTASPASAAPTTTDTRHGQRMIAETPGIPGWSANSRSGQLRTTGTPHDSSHDPGTKDDTDISAPPTRPHRNRRTNTPTSRLERVSRRTLSNTTRTCNKLRSVNWYTGEVM